MDEESGEVNTTPFSTEADVESVTNAQTQQPLEKPNPSEKVEKDSEVDNMLQNPEITKEIQIIEQPTSAPSILATEKTGEKKKETVFTRKVSLSCSKKE